MSHNSAANRRRSEKLDREYFAQESLYCKIAHEDTDLKEANVRSLL